MKSFVLTFAVAAFVIALAGCSSNAPSRKLLSFEEFRAGAATQNATPDCKSEDCQSRRLELRYVVYVGKQIYCYWELKQAETKTDFNALAATLETGITDQTSYSDYYLALRKWASAFHDGHVNVMAKSDVSALEIYTAPVRVEVMAPATDHEKVVISSVTPGVVNVTAGDEVIAINGVPVRDALTLAARDSASGSTERMRRFSAGRRLVDVLGLEAGSTPLEFTLKSSTGSVKTVTLSRSIEVDAKPIKDTDDEDTTGAELITAKILPNGFGYLRLDGFEGTQDDKLISGVMDRLANTKGLIIDLRRNGGGDLSGDRLIERLATTSVVRYKRSERLNDFILQQRPENFSLGADATGSFAAWHDLKVEPLASAHYAKPVVALISPYCFSACDTFAAALKANGLAVLVGEATGGGTGTPLAFDLPTSPLRFRYSVVRGMTAKGDAIEGVGTTPDTYLEPTLGDILKSEDSQLAKASDILMSLVSPISNPTTPATVPVVVSPSPRSSPSPSVQTAIARLLSVSDQALERSPTAVENDHLLRISKHDEL